MPSGFLYKGNTARAGLGFSPEKLLRRGMREKLAEKGFVWIRGSGVPAGSEWNIDNYDTGALENMAKAFAKYGAIVAEMHNTKQFNRIMAEDYSKVASAVEAEMKRRQQDIPSEIDSNGSENSDSVDQKLSQFQQEVQQYLQSQNQSGSGTPPWLPFAMLGAGGLVLLLVLR